MLLLDHPYVSDILRRTVIDHRLPVVLTPAAHELGFADAPGALAEPDAVARLHDDPHTRVLSNSENAIGWVAANLGFTGLPAAVERCKNKLTFRRMLRDRYPDFRFREVRPDELDALDPEAIGHPFVIKPAIGFFSLGVHVVNRVAEDGRITPIEFNPLRFSGWCTTADLTVLGYGFNPYLAFLNDERPDWPAVFAERRDRLYAIVVLDDSTGVDPASITGFDHDRLAERFTRTLEHRPMDVRKTGVFGFLFVETPVERRDELEWVLHSDLREFVRTAGDG